MKDALQLIQPIIVYKKHIYVLLLNQSVISPQQLYLQKPDRGQKSGQQAAALTGHASNAYDSGALRGKRAIGAVGAN